MNQTTEITLTLQPFEHDPGEMRDKFMVQSIETDLEGASLEDLNDMWSNAAKNKI